MTIKMTNAANSVRFSFCEDGVHMTNSLGHHVVLSEEEAWERMAVLQAAGWAQA